jgi:molybdate transport system ATP-binding protein
MVEITVTGLDAKIVVGRGEDFRLDMELRIPPGRTVALLGPNGAGKTTAVMAIAGVIPIDGGHIRLGDHLLDDPRSEVLVPPERRNIGVVFQDYLLFPHLSVVDNVAFGLRSTGTGKSEARRAARLWMDHLEIGELAAARPADLSGGEAQRAAIARALVTEPRLLLLDEPLAALDVTIRAHLRRLLADHLDGFLGPRLLITHEPTEAFLLADEIHVLEDGRITQIGTPDDIRLRPRTRYIADLAGANLLTGWASGGTVVVSDFELHAADTQTEGPVLVTIHPRAISVHRRQPEGSARNTWPTTIKRLEHYGDRVRLQTDLPIPLTAEITPGAARELSLEQGGEIWLSMKATEISLGAA